MSLAVKAENAMVSRMTPMTLTQNKEEGVRSFAVRLRSQTNVCMFSKHCSHKPSGAVNYIDDMARDALIRRLRDREFQQNVLGHNDQYMTLEDTIKFIEAVGASQLRDQKLEFERD